MKKLFTIALAVLICAAMFAACEGQQAESESQQHSRQQKGLYGVRKNCEHENLRNT